MLRGFRVRSMCLLLFGFMRLSLPMATLAQDSADQHAKLQLVSEQDAIVPHQPLRLGIRFDLEEGWHTYWVNPGDSGEPPRIKWKLPAGFKVGSMQWPYPSRLSTPPLVDYGYEHQVLLAAVVQPPLQLEESSTEEFVAQVHYLVCRDVCIPGQKQLVLTLPVKTHAGAGSDHALFDATRQRLPKPIPGGWKIWAASVGDEFLLTLRTGSLTENLRAKDPQFFPLEAEQIDNAAPQKASAIPGAVRLHLKKSNHLLKPISRMRGVMVVSGAAYVVDIPISQASP